MVCRPFGFKLILLIGRLTDLVIELGDVVVSTDADADVGGDADADAVIVAGSAANIGELDD